MCNQGIALHRSEALTLTPTQSNPSMDSPTASSSPSAGAAGDRAKFLCSFGGSILPRPLDGRLRYVGGETRIVSLPRHVSFDDLLARMRELFDGASVIKYQQPDEDLDALVSVVNDDDVVNMMEEYDKLVSAADGGGAGGFTRLRIFLFSHNTTDPDAAAAAAAAHFDIDERETERRYVDALNSLNDSKPPSPPELSDQFFGPSVNLHRLNIPHPHLETPWSPAYFSPGGRDLREFPPSPSSARYQHVGPGEFSEQPAQFDHQSTPVMDNMVWLPPGAIVQEKAGFPSNLGHSHNVFEGGNSSICEHCRMAFQRSQTPMADSRYIDPRWNQPPSAGNEYISHFSSSCAECYRNYNGVHHHHQSSHRVEDPRIHIPGTGGRVGDHYIVEGNVVSVPYGHGNFYDGHDDGRYLRTGPEYGNEVFHAQQAVGHGNHPSQYGVDNLYQVPHNLPPIQSLRRQVQVPIRPGATYESPLGLMTPNGFMRSPHEGSPGFPRIGVDDQIQNPWGGQNGVSSQKLYGIEDHSFMLNPAAAVQDAQLNFVPDALALSAANAGMRAEEEKGENLDSDSKGLMAAEVAKLDSEANMGKEDGAIHVECLTYLPELINSVKKAVIESAEEVKARAKENTENKEKSSLHELEPGNGQAEVEPELDGDGEHKANSKIESTTAEVEALAKGLQTIKNDDLEQIRELGSGTYGSVYHGKWKGSDVAIKRIKASCFAGKPSDRERLIADFWKEALILSSLHHPNVVSFYGVVRDGPDGSLATVTEFMVNGSLKQFLQKKDRTIDRRKRLIIAMDAAFGMEYLHGKNIVHFDLKCENLLVNMRDPQRPVCKIGDLGLSKVKQHTLVSGGVRGTLPWMAPELLSGKSNMVTEKIDVYSFGVVMWELLTGEEPYADMRCASIIGGIVNNTLRPQIPTWCDPEWKSLMESCWASDPGERPSFSEISQKLRKMSAAINVK